MTSRGMGSSSLVMLLAACFLLIGYSTAYRLNVPRVLLPYHGNLPAKFILEISQPTGGCFYWRSSRPDVVAVSSLAATEGGCSDRAEVRSTSKALAGGDAVIFAEERESGSALSCSVTVDAIASIRLETTTRILYVDADPARMKVVAFNSKGDKFSTLHEISVEWELVHTGGDRPLRIVPFEQSAYEAPQEIVVLEKQKKKGYVILVEGVLTGSATLTAKFNDQYLKHIAPDSLELTVVANLLLIPSYDLYVPVHAVIPFSVMIVKQSKTEVVPMPSTSYYLHVDDKNICALDVPTSSVTALVRGKTEVHLLNHNVDVVAMRGVGVRPPSTSVYVVDPETLQWSVDGGNWILQANKKYRLHVSLMDPHGNSMFISDNLRFDSKLSGDNQKYFDIHVASKNQTYFEVTPIKIGKTTLKSKFVAVMEGNTEHKQSGTVAGEQSVQIVEPVVVEPQHVIFPYLPRRQSSFRMKASGGSGVYDWSIGDSSISGIDATNGILTSGALGSTRVTATDRRNPALLDTAQVSVLEVASLTFGETRKEAEEGHILILNVQLMGAGPDGPLPFTDCRSVPFQVKLPDSSIFEVVQDHKQSLPTEGTGCATVALKAIKSGDTTVTVSFDTLTTTIQISAYPALKINVDDVALALASSHSIFLSGGPRPWLLDPTKHFRSASTKSLATTLINNDSEEANIQCLNKEGSTVARIRVGNAVSTSLPLPAISEITVSICCAKPTSIRIQANTSADLTRCPIAARVLLTKGVASLVLKGYGTCEKTEGRPLDSISSLSIKWQSKNKNLLTVSPKSSLPSGASHANAVGLGKPGNVEVTAEVVPAGDLKTASIELHLVEPAVAVPNSLVLWNEKLALGQISMKGGSGVFAVQDLPGSPFAAAVDNEKITVTPNKQGEGTLRVLDLCMSKYQLDVPVKITDIYALAIRAPLYVEVGSEIEVTVEAVDQSGASFTTGLLGKALMGATMLASNSHLHVSKSTDPDRFSIRAVSVGAVSLSASAKSSSGRNLQSQPHTIQVFSPISLHPKIVTLIPESTFQLEVIGGPHPTPPIDFSLNNSAVASIKPNALITSTSLGYTTVTGTVNVGTGHVTKDTVLVRVVSLASLRIMASTQRAEQGGRVWVRLQGVDADETPFAFGGALYPFTVKWSVSHANVLRMVSPFGSSVAETSDNRYSLFLDANAAGTATVKVRIDLHDKALKHFVGSKRFMESEVEIHVVEPLALHRPELPIGVVRIAPSAQLQLQTKRSSSSVVYSVPSEYTGRVTVSPTGLLRSLSMEGPAVLAISSSHTSDNDTTLIPVAVNSVHSLDLIAENGIESSSDAILYYLPVGTTVTLNVNFRDSRARILHAASNRISYRPHRFDLTEIVAGDLNRTLTITLKSAGETVLQVWDTATPSLSVFVRLSAAESLLSVSRPPVVSDILCFRSPLTGHVRWSSDGSLLQWIDPELGVAKLIRPGTVQITAKMDQHSLHSTLLVGSASQLSFSTESRPEFVSNLPSSKYVFPVNVANGTTTTHVQAITECSEPQRRALSSVSAPFDCSVSFTSAAAVGPAVNLLFAKPVYLVETGSYACVLERIEAGTVHLRTSEAVQTDLVVTAKWNADNKVFEAKTQVPFHLAMDVVESEIALSNLDDKSSTSLLSIHVPAYQSKQVTVLGCEGDIVTIKEIRAPTDASSANKFFSVKLNVKSVAVWSELAPKCALIVENKLTGQTVQVPIKVKLVGDAAKHVYNALDSKGFIDFVLIFIHKYQWMIPSLMAVVMILIASIAVYIFFYKRFAAQQGSYGDETTMRSRNNSSFMSNTHPGLINTSYQSSPSFMRASPVFKSTPLSPASPTGLNNSYTSGSPGDGTLWSTKNGPRRRAQ